MKQQRGYLNITSFDLLVWLAMVVIAGGFVVYVALPWVWRTIIKPLLLWVLL